jgi:hypothetical protein
MRSHFDPEFSHSSSLKMLPTFSKTIISWVEGLSGGEEKKQEVFAADVVTGCKMLAFRLIAMSIYGEALDEEVGFPSSSYFLSSQTKTNEESDLWDIEGS